MNACTLVTVAATAVLLIVLFSPRYITATKEGFVEYVVYGPGWWRPYGGRRWWARHYYMPYGPGPLYFY